jgi:hypothetical protein
VHEIEIDVLHAEAVEAGVDGGQGRFVSLIAVPGLGRDENLGSIDPGYGDCPSLTLNVPKPRRGMSTLP